jgi:hypothetical protein
MVSEVSWVAGVCATKWLSTSFLYAILAKEAVLLSGLVMVEVKIDYSLESATLMSSLVEVKID